MPGMGGGDVQVPPGGVLSQGEGHRSTGHLLSSPLIYRTCNTHTHKEDYKVKCDLCDNEAQLHMTEIATTTHEDGTITKKKTGEHHCTAHPFPGHEKEASDIKAFEKWILDFPNWSKDAKKEKHPPMMVLISMAWQAGMKHGRENP